MPVKTVCAKLAVNKSVGVGTIVAVGSRALIVAIEASGMLAGADGFGVDTRTIGRGVAVRHRAGVGGSVEQAERIRLLIAINTSARMPLAMLS